MLPKEEVFKILFNDRFFEGGNGKGEDAYKGPYSNRKAKSYSEIIQSRYICGWIRCV